MRCYKDMTFCATDCVNYECHRNRVWVDYDEVEEGMGVSWADFREHCDYYTPKAVKDNNG